MLKAPGTKRWKLAYDGLLSIFGFKVNVCRYTVASMGSVKLKDSMFRRCEAALGGGVAAFDASLLRISGSTLHSCSATASGGGVVSGTAAVVTLDGSVLDNCTAGRQGLTLVHISARRKRFLWDRG